MVLENLTEKRTFEQRSEAGKEGAIDIPKGRVFQMKGSMPSVWQDQQGGQCIWSGMNKIPFFLPFQETATLCTFYNWITVIGRVKGVLFSYVTFFNISNTCTCSL